MSEKRISLASILIASIGVVALIGGIVFFFSGSFGGEGADGQEQLAGVDESVMGDAATGMPPVDPNDPEASPCGLTEYSAENDLETTAPETEWEWFEGYFITARNEVSGPAVVEEDGYRYCYSRTATGLLFAAYNYIILGSVFPANELVDRVVPGSLQDQMQQNSSPKDPDRRKFEPAGFRIINYTGSDAVVEIVTSYEDALVSLKMQLRWFEGDWKMNPLANDEIAFDVEVRESLAGYVPWSPRG